MKRHCLSFWKWQDGKTPLTSMKVVLHACTLHHTSMEIMRGGEMEPFAEPQKQVETRQEERT